MTHIFRELDIVSTQAEDQVRCVAQVDAVFYGLEKERKSLQVKINSSSALIAELSRAQRLYVVRPHLHVSGCEIAHLLAHFSIDRGFRSMF